MRYLSPDNLLAGFELYNNIIREVANETGAILIDNENSIPGDPIHFVDSVHFTDKGSQLQTKRVVAGPMASSVLKDDRPVPALVGFKGTSTTVVNGTAHCQEEVRADRSVLDDFGSEADWQTLRNALPPLVADHENPERIDEPYDEDWPHYEEPFVTVR